MMGSSNHSGWIQVEGRGVQQRHPGHASAGVEAASAFAVCGVGTRLAGVAGSVSRGREGSPKRGQPGQPVEPPANARRPAGWLVEGPSGRQDGTWAGVRPPPPLGDRRELSRGRAQLG